MSEIPSGLPPIEHHKKIPTAETEKKAAAGSVNTHHYPQPFPSMSMTDPEKKMFWDNMSKQMMSAINEQTQHMKEALQKLKESEEDS
jgi:hypothetical protein